MGLCDAHLARQCISGSFEGATWSADGRCVSCWSEVDASDSWLLGSGHRVCQSCATTVAAELRRVEDNPALRCLACDCLLQRPLHLGLDGRARCPGCRKRLVSATTLTRRTVLRLILLWLKACSRLCPRIVGAARGVYLPLGRRLVLAGLQALSPSPQPAREAILLVSLAAVGPVFGRATFDWLHEVWNERGWLSEDLGRWMLGAMGTADEATLHMIRVKDTGPLAQIAMPSLVDGSDFLSAAATRVAVDKPAELAAAVDVKVFSLCPAAPLQCWSRGGGARHAGSRRPIWRSLPAGWQWSWQGSCRRSGRVLGCCTMGCRCTRWERPSSARRLRLIWVDPALQTLSVC